MIAMATPSRVMNVIFRASPLPPLRGGLSRPRRGVTLQFVECRTHGGDVLEAWRAATDGVDDRALQGRDVGGWDRPRLEAPVRRLTQISPFEQIRRRRLQCGCAAVDHADLLGCHVACADAVRLGRHGVLIP